MTARRHKPWSRIVPAKSVEQLEAEGYRRDGPNRWSKSATWEDIAQALSDALRHPASRATATSHVAPAGGGTFLQHEQNAECCFCRSERRCVVGARVAWGAMLPTICDECARTAFLRLHGAKL